LFGPVAKSEAAPSLSLEQGKGSIALASIEQAQPSKKKGGRPPLNASTWPLKKAKAGPTSLLTAMPWFKL
jgi:hypothetical protein